MREYEVVIVGGGVGGVYTALNLIERGFNPGKIALIADEWPPYSRHRLASILLHRSRIKESIIGVRDRLGGEGVKILKCRAKRVNVESHEVVIDLNGHEEIIAYRKLVVATGGLPKVPPIKGAGLKGVVTFHSLRDVEFLKSLQPGSKVLVIGGGLVGLAAAVALSRLGHRVAIVEVKDCLLPQLVECELALIVRRYLEVVEGVKVFTNTVVEELTGSSSVEGAKLSSGELLRINAAVIATGVKPNSAILRDAGAELMGEAVKVNQSSMTSLPDVYALGDCAVSKDLITGRMVYRPLGFIAAHYSKVVAESIIKGCEVSDSGALPVIYERIGNLRIYRIGLSLNEALALGVNAEAKVMVGSGEASAEVIDDSGRIIGWELIHVGHKHLRNTASYLRVMSNLKIIHSSQP